MAKRKLLNSKPLQRVDERRMDSVGLSEIDQLPLSPVHRCPFLGVGADATTYSACNERPNYCHRTRPISPVSHERQKLVCCVEGHQACPIFAGPRPARNFPLAWTNLNANRKKRLRPWVLVVVSFSILLMVLIGYIFQHELADVFYGYSRASGQANPTLSILIKPTHTLTPSLTFNPSFTSMVPTAMTPTATLTMTSSASPTRSPTLLPTHSLVPTVTIRPLSPTPGPALETPFGPGRAYLIHRVKSGEYLISIAASYQTSVAALRALNALKPDGLLMTGALLVIAPGQTNPSSLPALKPLLITTRTRVADLAQKYAMSAVELRQINAIGPDEWVEAGRYMLVRIF
jgi:LysM repeat protein